MVQSSQTKSLLLLIFTILYYALISPSTCGSLEGSQSAINCHKWHRNGLGRNAANSLESGSSSYCLDKRSLVQSLLSLAKKYQKIRDKSPRSWDLSYILLTEYRDDERLKRFDGYGHVGFTNDVVRNCSMITAICVLVEMFLLTILSSTKSEIIIWAD
uniref:Uncharacterized protein n=1 Tax=Glossina pallidipes TaxID=7398 RepID=A0A1A9ZXR0_GLOPL